MSTINETGANTVAKKEKLVKIRIPIERDNTADVYVSVNDRNWLIKRGSEVEVPECVVEVLNNQQAALEKAYNYQNSVENN